MNTKVCGITTFKQLQQLDGLEIDMAGMVFIPGSPWYAGDSLDPKEVSKADFDLKKVGVMKNPSLSEALDWIDAYKLDVVQLCGEENAELCDDLSSEVEVIKVFYLQEETKNVDALLKAYDSVCDYYLFSGVPAVAGNLYGTRFDWTILKTARIEKPFLLGGGITAADASRLRAFSHPDFFGVDLDIAFETAPGEKDLKELLQFRQLIK
jgi:phosphoribosylanthranilate isomerase